MSEQAGQREKVPQDPQRPGGVAPTDYIDRRPQGIGNAAIGLIALGVGAAVFGAVVLGPAIGTQFRSRSGPPEGARAGSPAPAPVGPEGAPAAVVSPTDPLGNHSALSTRGVTPDSSLNPLTADRTGNPTGSADGMSSDLAADPLGTLQKGPHEQMGPPLPPELAAQRARERMAELNPTLPKTDLQTPMEPTDPRLRGLDGSTLPLDANARTPRPATGPLGSLAEPAAREPGNTASPTTTLRSTEPSPVATAPNLSPLAPGGPKATAPVSVPILPADAGPLIPPAAVGPTPATPTPAPSRAMPTTAGPRGNGKYRYRVRVGQFATEGAAHRYRRQLFQATGRGAEVVPDGDGFRLEVGAYDDSIAAQRVADDLRAHSYQPEVSEPKSPGVGPR